MKYVQRLKQQSVLICSCQCNKINHDNSSFCFKRRSAFYSACVHVCIPDGFSHDAVQGPHLSTVCEAGQGGSQSLTEPLSFLPGALPAQPLLVKHLTRQEFTTVKNASSTAIRSCDLEDEVTICTVNKPLKTQDRSSI